MTDAEYRLTTRLLQGSCWRRCSLRTLQRKAWPLCQAWRLVSLLTFPLALHEAHMLPRRGLRSISHQSLMSALRWVQVFCLLPPSSLESSHSYRKGTGQTWPTGQSFCMAASPELSGMQATCAPSLPQGILALASVLPTPFCNVGWSSPVFGAFSCWESSATPKPRLDSGSLQPLC